MIAEELIASIESLNATLQNNLKAMSGREKVQNVNAIKEQAALNKAIRTVLKSNADFMKSLMKKIEEGNKKAEIFYRMIHSYKIDKLINHLYKNNELEENEREALLEYLKDFNDFSKDLSQKMNLNLQEILEEFSDFAKKDNYNESFRKTTFRKLVEISRKNFNLNEISSEYLKMLSSESGVLGEGLGNVVRAIKENDDTLSFIKINTDLKQIINNTDDIKAIERNFFDTLTQSIGKLAAGAMQKSSSFMKGLLELFLASFGLGILNALGIPEMILGLIASGISGIFKVVKKVLFGIYKSHPEGLITGLINKIKTVFVDGFKGFKTVIKDTFSSFKTGKIFEKIPKFSIKGIFEEVKNFKFFKTFGELIKPLSGIEKFLKPLGGLLKFAKPIFNILRPFSKLIAPLTGILIALDAIIGFVKTSGGIDRKIAGAVGEIISGFTFGLFKREWMVKFYDSIKKVLIDWWNIAVNFYIENFKEPINELINSGKELYNTVVKVFGSEFSDFISASLKLWDELGVPLFQTLGDLISVYMKTVFPYVKLFFKSYLKFMLNNIKNGIHSLTVIVKSITTIIEIIGSIKDFIKKAFDFFHIGQTKEINTLDLLGKVSPIFAPISFSKKILDKISENQKKKEEEKSNIVSATIKNIGNLFTPSKVKEKPPEEKEEKSGSVGLGAIANPEYSPLGSQLGQNAERMYGHIYKSSHYCYAAVKNILKSVGLPVTYSSRYGKYAKQFAAWASAQPAYRKNFNIYGAGTYDYANLPVGTIAVWDGIRPGHPGHIEIKSNSGKWISDFAHTGYPYRGKRQVKALFVPKGSPSLTAMPSIFGGYKKLKNVIESLMGGNYATKTLEAPTAGVTTNVTAAVTPIDTMSTTPIESIASIPNYIFEAVNKTLNQAQTEFNKARERERTEPELPPEIKHPVYPLIPPKTSTNVSTIFSIDDPQLNLLTYALNH